MIEVERLCKYFGAITAVEDVTFSIEKGEIVGFLGPNGAGKTTTMRILTGFSPPSSGTARVDGIDVTVDPISVKRRLGYLPESVPLYPEMTVNQFLDYIAEVKGLPRAKRRVEVDRVKQRCGLGDMGRRTIGHLSKGYRQRAGLAQALVNSPPVLVLDEPTVGLDPQQIVEIRQMIKGFAREHTVLLSTHILPEVSMICERVMIIHQGRIVAQGPMSDFAGAHGETVWLDIEARGSQDAVVKQLTGLITVKTVRPGPDGSYGVEIVNTPEAREAIASALVGAGLGLLSMRIRTGTLEDVFIEAISKGKGE